MLFDAGLIIEDLHIINNKDLRLSPTMLHLAFIMLHMSLMFYICPYNVTSLAR